MPYRPPRSTEWEFLQTFRKFANGSEINNIVSEFNTETNEAIRTGNSNIKPSTVKARTTLIRNQQREQRIYVSEQNHRRNEITQQAKLDKQRHERKQAYYTYKRQKHIGEGLNHKLGDLRNIYAILQGQGDRHAYQTTTTALKGTSKERLDHNGRKSRKGSTKDTHSVLNW